MPDHREIVIDTLAESEAELREQCRAFREVARAAIHKLAEMQGTIDRQRTSIEQLRQELRIRMGLERRTSERAA